MNTGQACSRSQGQLQGYHIKHTHTQKFSVVTQKQFTVLAAPDLHVFGLNIIQRLNQMFSHFLVLLHIYTSWFCTFYFLCIFPLSVSLYLLYPPPPSGPVKLSSVCGGVSPVPPVLSLSRSIKRRTHAGCLKSPPTLPYGWWTGRCSNHTQLYLGRRSILLICFCTPAIGFPRSHED